MNSIAGKYCPYCQKAFTAEDTALICSKCNTPHHHQCWVENQGCAVVGCDGSFVDAESYDPDFHKSPQETVFHSDEPSGPSLSGDTKSCPHCGETIPQAAVFCVHCRTMLQDPKLDSNGRLAVIDTIVDGLKTGWNLLVENLGFLLLLELVLLIAPFATAVIAGLVSMIIPPLSVVFGLAGIVLSMIVAVGVQKIFFKLFDRQQVDLSDIFSATDRVLPFIGVGFLAALGTMLGAFLLVLPGFIFAFFVWLAPVAVVDRPVGAVEALSISMRIVRDNIFLTLGMLLVVMVLNMLGALFFGLGVLITGPISSFFIIYCYRKMLHQNINK